MVVDKSEMSRHLSRLRVRWQLTLEREKHCVIAERETFILNAEVDHWTILAEQFSQGHVDDLRAYATTIEGELDWFLDESQRVLSSTVDTESQIERINTQITSQWQKLQPLFPSTTATERVGLTAGVYHPSSEDAVEDYCSNMEGIVVSGEGEGVERAGLNRLVDHRRLRDEAEALLTNVRERVQLLVGNVLAHTPQDLKLSLTGAFRAAEDAMKDWKVASSEFTGTLNRMLQAETALTCSNEKLALLQDITQPMLRSYRAKRRDYSPRLEAVASMPSSKELFQSLFCDSLWKWCSHRSLAPTSFEQHNDPKPAWGDSHSPLREQWRQLSSTAPVPATLSPLPPSSHAHRPQQWAAVALKDQQRGVDPAYSPTFPDPLPSGVTVLQSVNLSDDASTPSRAKGVDPPPTTREQSQQAGPATATSPPATSPPATSPPATSPPARPLPARPAAPPPDVASLGDGAPTEATATATAPTTSPQPRGSPSTERLCAFAFGLHLKVKQTAGGRALGRWHRLLDFEWLNSHVRRKQILDRVKAQPPKKFRLKTITMLALGMAKMNAQVGGHVDNFKKSSEEGYILKKEDEQEVANYKIMSTDKFVRPWIADLDSITQLNISEDKDEPVYERYMKLEDFLHGMKKPTVMDCKVGVRTFLESETKNKKLRKDLLEKMIKLSPTEPTEEEMKQGITKLRYMQFRERESSSSNLQFRIEGIKPVSSDLGIEYKKVKSLDEVTAVFQKYVEQAGSEDSLVVPQFLASRFSLQLGKLVNDLEHSSFVKTREVVGSSILLIFDAADPEHPDGVKVRWIDFAKTVECDKELTHRIPWEDGNREDMFFTGLENMKNIFSQLYWNK